MRPQPTPKSMRNLRNHPENKHKLAKEERKRKAEKKKTDKEIARLAALADPKTYVGNYVYNFAEHNKGEVKKANVLIKWLNVIKNDSSSNILDMDVE